MRLDRLLSNLGYGSRREVQHFIKNGFITLDGEQLCVPEQHLTISEDLRTRMIVDGEALDPLPGLTLLMHKPVGVTCSHKEEGDLVYDLLPPRWRKREPVLSTVGRLDKETSGLLLLTDNGALLQRIISPKRNIPKRYKAILERPLKGNETEIFAAGSLMLDGERKPLLPAQLEIHSPKQATVIISEGRYHQVRRMFAAVGNHVVSLHRESIGSLTLPNDLAAGEYRILCEQDLSPIFSS